ncbi:MAG TPA: methyltransferase domain-containing protein, partial [Pirellulales bacterium]
YYRGGILSERSAAPQIDVAQPIAAERTRTANRTPSRAATNGAAMAGRNADLTATAVLEPEDREEPRDGDDVPVASEPSASRTPVLIEFRHGLGDAVQLTIVLKHLRRQQPDWDVDVAALPGKHTAFHGLCRRAIVLDRDPSPEHRRYSQVFRLDWHECRTAYRNWPSTKPSRCLLEVFQTSPDPDLCRYEIAVGEDARRRADGYLASVAATGPNPEGRYPVVLLHYQGNTSEDRKNLSHETAREICEAAIRSGRIPVILDWDRRSPLPDGARIHCPGADDPLWSGLGTGDAETLAALIGAAELMVGIDSGPLHVAGATSTPTLAVWVGHHPVHFFDLAPNVLHLVPSGGNGAASGPAALEYFQKQYASHTYLSLNVDIPAMVEHKLTGESLETVANKRFLAQLRAKSYGEAYYEEHRRAGLDYLNYGGWQQEYGRWLVESLDLKGKRLLDVGSACGAILRGLGQAGAVVQGVEINEYMVRLGRQKWPDMACLMHICDAVNLHLFDDGEWDAIHTAQVAEHWKPQLVPHILDELHRVVKPDGLLFCSLDTTELFARQGRTMAHEDPTHVCIQTMAWWRTRLAEAGWDDVTTTWEPRLREHPGAFLQKYDWDWFVARRRP